MCDIFWGYINEISVLTFIYDVVLSINTQNYPYDLELLILHYFRNSLFGTVVNVSDNGMSTSIKMR